MKPHDRTERTRQRDVSLSAQSRLINLIDACLALLQEDRITHAALNDAVQRARETR